MLQQLSRLPPRPASAVNDHLPPLPPRRPPSPLSLKPFPTPGPEAPGEGTRPRFAASRPARAAISHGEPGGRPGGGPRSGPRSARRRRARGSSPPAAASAPSGPRRGAGSWRGRLLPLSTARPGTHLPPGPPWPAAPRPLPGRRRRRRRQSAVPSNRDSPEPPGAAAARLPPARQRRVRRSSA